MAFDVPVRAEFALSVAVIVWFPAVNSVAVNAPVPLLSVTSSLANEAAVSELVKWIVSPKPEITLLSRLSAVTVKLTAPPAVTLVGAETAKCTAAVTPGAWLPHGLTAPAPKTGRTGVHVVRIAAAPARPCAAGRCRGSAGECGEHHAGKRHRDSSTQEPSCRACIHVNLLEPPFQVDARW